MCSQASGAKAARGGVLRLRLPDAGFGIDSHGFTVAIVNVESLKLYA